MSIRTGEHRFAELLRKLMEVGSKIDVAHPAFGAQLHLQIADCLHALDGACEGPSGNGICEA